MVCLFATPTGTEVLKNLILPGVGHVTLVDDALAVVGDTGNNFFITRIEDEQKEGVKRGSEARRGLQDLNGHVRVDWVDADPVEWIRQGRLEGVNVVVVADRLPWELLLWLEEQCVELGVHLVIARAVGLIGYVRLSGSGHQGSRKYRWADCSLGSKE